MRDLGGLEAGSGRTRPGVLFRSDALDLLSDADIALLTRAHRVEHVLDLRSAEERLEGGPTPLALAGVPHHHLPVIDGDDLERRRSARAAAVAAGQEPDEIMADGYAELPPVLTLASGPSPVVPEAPWPVLLPLVGLTTLLFVARRRRRGGPARVA